MDDIPYDDAIDLLDADHKLVKQQFTDYQALSEDGAPPELKQQLARKICMELTVHTQIEEEIFYPQVRKAIKDEKLMDEAMQEHAEAKKEIAQLQGMDADEEGYDALVQQLGKAVMGHVMEEREQIFLKAKFAAIDLRGMAAQLYQRKKELMGQLQKGGAARAKKVAA